MRFLLLLFLLVAEPASAHLYSGLIGERRYAEVEQALRLRLAQHPGDAEALAGAAELALARGAPGYIDEALRFADACVRAHPAEAECHLMRARALVARRDAAGLSQRWLLTRQALAAFAHALDDEPRNLHVRVGMARLQLDSGWWLGGGVSRARALAADTGRIHPDVSNLIQAWCEFAEGRAAKAEELSLTLNLGGAEAVLGDQADLLWALGLAYHGQRAGKDARRVFSELQRRFPAQWRGYHGLGLVEQQAGAHERALGWFENALAVQARPETARALADSALALGDKARAIRAMEQALAMQVEWEAKARAAMVARLAALKRG